MSGGHEKSFLKVSGQKKTTKKGKTKKRRSKASNCINDKINWWRVFISRNNNVNLNILKNINFADCFIFQDRSFSNFI